MILIVGLGNPGQEYASTRHNFGFMVLDALANELNLDWHNEDKFNAEVAEVNSHHHSGRILLAKPQTLMNLSGEAVSRLANFYKIAPQHIWVVADDLDLPLGKIRVRHNGETAGHHGLDSITEKLGHKDFPRVRLGIRGDGLREELRQRNVDSNQFVTSSFETKEEEAVNKAISTAVTLIKEGIELGELKAHSYEINGFDLQSA
jgi:PTH1 family peptidyl-tRNA hydrolase